MNFQQFQNLSDGAKAEYRLTTIANECVEHPALFRDPCLQLLRECSDPKERFFMPFTVMLALDRLSQAAPDKRINGSIAREILVKFSGPLELSPVARPYANDIPRIANTIRTKIEIRAPGWLAELPEAERPRIDPSEHVLRWLKNAGPIWG